MRSRSNIQPEFDATYYPDMVQELALAMKKFMDAGMTSTEAQAATQAYATMRAAMMQLQSEAYQRHRDRSAQDYQNRIGHHDVRIR